MDAVDEEASPKSDAYTPAVEFEENEYVPCSEFLPDDSREVWLIQEPLHQLSRDDFEGKEISLKMDVDRLGKLTSSSGKSFKLVSSTSEGIDAAGFIGVDSNSIISGVKISRHVCLVHYPDASDVEKRKARLTSSSHKSGVSETSTRNRSQAPSDRRVTHSGNRTSHDTLTSMHTIGQSIASTKQSSRKRDKEISSSMQRGMSSGHHSQASLPESQVTGNSFGSPDESPVPRSKKRKKFKQ